MSEEVDGREWSGVLGVAIDLELGENVRQNLSFGDVIKHQG